MRGIRFIRNSVAGLLLITGSLTALAFFSPASEVLAATCSTNDVIDCGVASIKQLRDRYNKDHTKGTQAIFSYFGLTSDTINKYDFKQGTLYRDGRVVVDGKTVATGAHTVGRENKAGSTKHTSDGYTFYSGPVDIRVVRDVRPLFVFYDGEGNYAGAIMIDCGNPVVYTKPVEKPKPKPEPKPKPKYIEVCRLSDKKYPVRIKEDDFDETKHSKDPNDCKEEPAPKPEPKKVKVCDPDTKKIITVDEADRNKYLDEDSEECKEKPVIETPAPQLPETGIAETLGVVGIGAMTSAAYYYVVSRREM